MEQPKRRLSAVWFADIVGYSSLSTHDEPAAMGLVELLQALCREIVPAHEGRVVKFIGDACLAEFASTDSAVRSAVALLERYIAGAAEHGQQSSLRIGVHLGEVTAAPDGDLYGDGINTASRLQHSAAPGQVIISEDVWRQLRQRPEFRFAPLGSLELRGITTQVLVYDVLFGSRAAIAPAVVSSPAPAPSPPAPSSNLRSIGFFVALIVVGGAIWIFSDSLQRRSEPRSEPPTAAPQQAPPASAPVAAEPSSKPADPAPSTVKRVVTSPPPAEAVATNDTAAARGRAGRAAMMAQYHPAEVRALLQRLIDAMNSNASADAFAPLGPAAVAAMTGRGAQQMRESFGAGLSMRLGRIDSAPLNTGRLPVKFVVLAKSDTRSEMPMLFIALIDRDPRGQLKLVDLRREMPGRRGRAGTR